jgi:hypothetical protein
MASPVEQDAELDQCRPPYARGLPLSLSSDSEGSRKERFGFVKI